MADSGVLPPLSDDECKRLRVSPEELVFFHRQIASICRLDLPLAEGLRVLSRETRSPRLRDLALEVEREVGNGSRLSQAVRKFPRVFPDLYVGLIEAGEETGNLAQVLEHLGGYSHAAWAARQSLKSILVYPAVALSLVLVISMGMLVGIVPKFKSLFDALGVELPAPTRLLLAVSGFLEARFPIIVGGVLGGVLVLWGLYQTARGRRWADLLLLNFPLTGRMFRGAAYFLFCRTLALLLRSGVPLARCLDLMSHAFSAGMLHVVCRDMHRAAANGEPISREAERGGFFPETFVWKVAFAERKGDLVPALEELAAFYEVETQTAARRGTGLLEPFLILVLAIFVGSIVLGIYLPILKIQEVVRGS